MSPLLLYVHMELLWSYIKTKVSTGMVDEKVTVILSGMVDEKVTVILMSYIMYIPRPRWKLRIGISLKDGSWEIIGVLIFCY